MEKLTEKLNLQLKAEQDAVKLYNQFVAKIDNTKIKNRIKEIINDEIIHIKLMRSGIYSQFYISWKY